MQAFHNQVAIKDKYLERVIMHQKADRLVKGATGGNGKGCAVACTLDMVYDHSRYPIELGIPEWLARLEDSLFEGMSLNKSQKWPEEFLRAIPVGADLEKIKTPFTIFILEECIRSMDACVFDRDKNPDVVRALKLSKAATTEMIRCHKENLDLSAAWSAAWSAESAASAASAARSAARSAAWSAAWSAESAARSAARSAAASAARSAESAARSAARSAAASAESAAWSAASAASAAWSAAESAAFDKYADTLIEMLKGIKT